MIGLWGARDDNSGLGNQTKEFYDHIKPDKTVVIDIEDICGKPRHPERFPDAKVLKLNEITHDVMVDFLTGLKSVYMVEIPYNYTLIKLARQMGVKTILNYNWEFLDYLQRDDYEKPDIFLSPSTWHLDEMNELFPNTVHIPFPVNTKIIKPRTYSRIRHFVHIASYELFEDRNGTQALIDAIPYIKSNIQITIYSQHKIPQIKDERVKIVNKNLKNYTDLYKYGQCLILPRRYGGQSLQLNEAMASGMTPLMPNMSPQSEFLPSELMMFPVKEFKKIMTRTKLDCAIIDPRSLAMYIDLLAGLNKIAVKRLNKLSLEYARSISWDKLKPKYEEICLR